MTITELIKQYGLPFKEVQLELTHLKIENKFQNYKKKFGEYIENHSALLKYSDSKNNECPVGEVLLEFKNEGKKEYKEFLHRFGDETFTNFKFNNPTLKKCKGLYIYTVEKNIVYIGKTITPFSKRINSGYGNISPRNCFIGGQATNCHINSCVAKTTGTVQLYLLPLDDDSIIDQRERKLISDINPEWNIQLKRG